MSRQAPDQRRGIQRALIELCLERSYAKVELSDLLGRAGVDEAAFRRYFTDLEDCFCSIYLEMRDELMRRVGAAFAARHGWRNQIRAVIWAMAAFIREEPGRARISFVEVWFAGERAKLIRDETIQGLFAMIDRGRQEREDSSLSPLTAEFVGRAVYQRLQVLIERDELEKLDTEIPELMYAVVLPYLGREAAEEELRTPPPAHSS